MGDAQGYERMWAVDHYTETSTWTGMVAYTDSDSLYVVISAALNKVTEQKRTAPDPCGY